MTIQTAPGRPTRRRVKAGAATDLAQPGAMAKAFVVLEIIAARGAPIAMADIVRATGLTKPTAHRITTALADMGLIERDPERRGYVEGPRMLALALDTLRSAAPRSLRHAILRSVSEAFGETCNFGVLAGSEVMYLDRVEAKWPLGLRFEAGSRVPAHCTAIGKLLLSLMAPAERETMIAMLPLTRYTSRTITDPSRLRAALAEIAEAGFGTDDQEFMDGVVCISVPVIADSGRVIGGIAVSAPQARIDLKQARTLVPTMRDAAGKLAATFGLGRSHPVGTTRTRLRG